MTTLPAQYSASELFWLYRSRWQIERLIKAMKQLLSLVRLRSHQPEPIRTTLLAWMLVWIWQEEAVQTYTWMVSKAIELTSGVQSCPMGQSTRSQLARGYEIMAKEYGGKRVFCLADSGPGVA